MAGRYRLLTLVASGGMGRVWRARDEVLDRLVAVKELLPPVTLPAADRGTALLSTMREARAAARLEHPGVVRIYDVLQVTGRTWIVMEYVESQSLQQYVARDGPLPHREAAEIGLAVLQALRAAHSAGVVHRDIKPANVLLAQDGRTMLTDFGLATLDAAPAGDRTGTAPLLGSPHYIAPERLRGVDTSSVASDLWSLGATLYTAVEGRPPFDRFSVAESLAAVLVEDPDPPQHPGPLHPVIATLMTRDPAARATSAQAHQALQDITHRARGVSAVPKPRPAHDSDVRFSPAVVAAPVTAAPPRPPGSDASNEPPLLQPRQRPDRRRIVVASVSVAAVLAAGSAALASSLNERRPGSAELSTQAQTAVPVAAATSACEPADRKTLSAASLQPAADAVPQGWRSYRDPTGFVVAAPGDWTRSQKASVVCLGAPDGSATFTVSRRSGVGSDPLQHWQSAERAAVTGATLPGYRKVTMGVLLVTGGGAEWEYSWQPASGPRLHTRQVLLSASGARTFELSWTTRDRDWDPSLSIQRDLLASFRDPSSATPTWAVPTPQRGIR